MVATPLRPASRFSCLAPYIYFAGNSSQFRPDFRQEPEDRAQLTALEGPSSWEPSLLTATSDHTGLANLFFPTAKKRNKAYDSVPAGVSPTEGELSFQF
jgi:hypothetical protein